MTFDAPDPKRTREADPSRLAGHIPSATSAQCTTGLLLRNSMTPGSIVAGRSCGSTTVATIMSQRSLNTTEIAVAHAIEVAVIGDAGCAIAGAELGAKVELDLGAAIGRLAGECAAGAPLIHGERPRHLRPERTNVGCVARHLARGPWRD